MIKFNYSDLTICNAFQCGNSFINIVRFDALVVFTVFHSKIKWIKIAIENNRNIRNPLFIFYMRSILHCKTFGFICSEWIKCNLDAILVEIFIKYLFAGNCRHK